MFDEPVELSCSQLEWRCGRESHTRPKGALGSPDELGSREDARAWEEQERHNVDGHNNGVKILQFMFDLQLPLTCKPWTTLSKPYNKVRGKYIYKEVFLRLSLLLCVYVDVNLHMWAYNTSAFSTQVKLRAACGRFVSLLERIFYAKTTHNYSKKWFLKSRTA